MGNQAGSLKKHLETAEKTGALSFTDKGLEKFPPDLVKVVGNLRNLDLSNNKIGSLPQNIGAFKMMKTLTLSKNKLSAIPEDLGKLSKLENLNLSFNFIQSVPNSFQQLKHLKEITLSHNQLTTFPLSLLNLKQLAIVDLSSNRLTSVPGQVGQMEATELVLNCNQISHLAKEVSKCPRLKTLRLEENCLALDSIPTALLTESGVSLLALEGNLFDVKKLDEVEGFDKYMERYTAVKRKLD
eukprot:GFUD01019926.1.p1 GENE.GFUD01019926.1~~GFUD01019926.1.p1  ORF type:complete len:241 (-),score=64.16 GFUD01019926.1:339-1061(-)